MQMKQVPVAMKRFHYMAVAIALSCLASKMLAQPISEPRQNLLSISPLLIPLYPNLHYWHSITKEIVLGGGVHFPWRRGLGSSSNVSGYGMTIEPQIYLNGKWIS